MGYVHKMDVKGNFLDPSEVFVRYRIYHIKHRLVKIVVITD